MSDLPPPSTPEPSRVADGSTPPTPPPPPPPPPNLTPPPGYVPYQVAPTPLSRLRRVKGVSTAVIVMTAIAGVGAVLAAIITPAVADRARDFLRGEITEDEFLESYGIVALTQLLQGVGTIAAAVLSIVWMYRLAANVRAVGRATTWAPIWAVFGWFLPPLLYVIPLLMLRELWKASDPTAPPGPSGWRTGSDNPWLYVWFLVYSILPLVLVAVSVNQLFGGGLGGDTDSIAETVDDFGALEIASTGLTVVSAIVWIVVVRQLTDRHRQLTNER